MQGVVSGGTVPNAIPDHAECTVDVRYKTQSGLDRIAKGFEEITKKQYIPDTKTVTVLTTRVEAMERLNSTMELFDKANAIVKANGLRELKAIAVGGGSDSAYLTKVGVPCLCAMGVRGEFNHTVREYAEEASLVDRTKVLLALLTEL